MSLRREEEKGQIRNENEQRDSEEDFMRRENDSSDVFVGKAHGMVAKSLVDS